MTERSLKQRSVSIKSIAASGVAAYNGRLLHYRRSHAAQVHRC